MITGGRPDVAIVRRGQTAVFRARAERIAALDLGA
jgi:hypothetical protein